jgi:hypothetical protein
MESVTFSVKQAPHFICLCIQGVVGEFDRVEFVVLDKEGEKA